MPAINRIEPKHFYDFLPSLDHRTGDIWRGLPTFGLYANKTTDAVVVTPACDLANQKCETITYLPIVSLEEYLSSSPYRYECWLEVQNALTKLKLADRVTPPNRFELALGDELKAALASLSSSELDTAAGKQVAAYLEYLKLTEKHEIAPISQIQRIFGKGRFKDQIDRAITNSLKADIHFLPADGQSTEYSAVKTHSLIAFRYPMTVPIELLDLAQRTTAQAWPIELERARPRCPSAASFLHWPVKLARLRDDFLADMLSRYVSMYIRLGSRDFSRETVEQISTEIIGE
jgi:hypothetical protein